MSTRWQDWMNAMLGCWLAISPSQMGYSLDHFASGNACGVGVLIVLFNIISAGRIIDAGQEIVNIVVGIWLILSPFALGFAVERGPALNTILVGTAVIIFSGWQMFDATAERGT